MTEAIETPTPRETRLLALTEISVDPHVNPRVHRNEQTIERYCALYREDTGADTTLPPLDVFLVDNRYVLADGHHRLLAAQQVRLTHLPCYVREGTRTEAFVCAVQRNATHGLPFTYADRDAIVRRLLADPQTGHLSLRELAKLAGVSHDFVRQRRKEHEARRSVEAAIQQRGVVGTSPQGIENTLYESDTGAPRSPVEERQALADLVGLTPQNVQQFERAHGPVKEQLIDLVEDGTPLADAISVVRQTMMQGLTAAPQPRMIPVPPLVYIPPAAPPLPAPKPSTTASTWGNTVHAALLGRVLGATPEPLTRVETLLVDALLADPALLAAASPDDVEAALALALRQTAAALRNWRARIDAAMEVVATFSQRSTLAKVQSTLTARLMQESPATARAMGTMAAQLRDWLKAPGDDRSARRTREL